MAFISGNGICIGVTINNGEHFNRDDHVLDDYQVVAIEKKTYGDEISRLTKESFWIKKLKTLQPEGLNK